MALPLFLKHLSHLKRKIPEKSINKDSSGINFLFNHNCRCCGQFPWPMGFLHHNVRDGRLP